MATLGYFKRRFVTQERPANISFKTKYRFANVYLVKLPLYHGNNTGIKKFMGVGNVRAA